MQEFSKLREGDKVAILSPSFAAPGKWPRVHELGLERMRTVFGLVPVEFPTTRLLGASSEARAADLIAAFTDPSIKAVVATIGGNDQVTYIKNLPTEPFANNPKPFFGYSDNSHFENFLWLAGVPSYYGGSLFTQFAMQSHMDDYTVEYLRHAFFDTGEFELRPSNTYNDVSLSWDEEENLTKERIHEPNDGWHWDGSTPGTGLSWGGCVESVDEMLRHNTPIPSLKQFESAVLIMETSEELPSASYVARVYRALGERGILERVQGVIVGRPKAWEFNKQQEAEEKEMYRREQRETTLHTIRTYNPTVPVIQNFDIGHTDPQIALPYGKKIRIDTPTKRIFAEF